MDQVNPFVTIGNRSISHKSTMSKMLQKASFSLLATVLLISAVLLLLKTEVKQVKVERNFEIEPPSMMMTVEEAAEQHGLFPKNKTIPFLMACADFAARRRNRKERVGGVCNFTCRVTSTKLSTDYEFCFNDAGRIIKIDRVAFMKL